MYLCNFSSNWAFGGCNFNIFNKTIYQSFCFKNISLRLCFVVVCVKPSSMLFSLFWNPGIQFIKFITFQNFTRTSLQTTWVEKCLFPQTGKIVFFQYFLNVRALSDFCGIILLCTGKTKVVNLTKEGFGRKTKLLSESEDFARIGRPEKF